MNNTLSYYNNNCHTLRDPSATYYGRCRFLRNQPCPTANNDSVQLSRRALGQLLFQLLAGVAGGSPTPYAWSGGVPGFGGPGPGSGPCTPGGAGALLPTAPAFGAGSPGWPGAFNSNWSGAAAGVRPGPISSNWQQPYQPTTYRGTTTLKPGQGFTVPGNGRHLSMGPDGAVVFGPPASNGARAAGGLGGGSGVLNALREMLLGMLGAGPQGPMFGPQGGMFAQPGAWGPPGYGPHQFGPPLPNSPGPFGPPSPCGPGPVQLLNQPVFEPPGAQAPGGCQKLDGKTVEDRYGLRFENGEIVTKGGQREKFGARGAIVVMPDGSSIGVGRTSQQSNQNVEAKFAGPGKRVPMDLPEKTMVFEMTREGRLVRKETADKYYGIPRGGPNQESEPNSSRRTVKRSKSGGIGKVLKTGAKLALGPAGALASSGIG